MGILSNPGHSAEGIVLVVMAFNLFCTLVKRILDRVAPASKADTIAGKAAAVTGTAIEFLSANSTYLPKEAQAALQAGVPGEKA